MKSLIAIWHLLSSSQRRKLVGLQVLSVLMACSTAGGIAAIVPFFAVLAEPAIIQRNALLSMLYQRLHFSSQTSFVVALGLGFALSVLLANAINLLGSLAINRFAIGVGNSFHVRLFGEYLGRDYQFHSQVNSAVLSTRVLYETTRVAAGMLQHALILVASLFTIVFILSTMLLLNPLVTGGAVLMLGTLYAVTYALTRRQLLRTGRAETRYHADRVQVINEGFAAIKEVQILQAQRYFIDRLDVLCRAIGRGELSTLAISLSPRSILECTIVLCLVSIALYLHSSEGFGPWVAQLSFIALAAYRLLPALQQTFTAIVKIRANAPALAGIAPDLRQATAVESMREGDGRQPALALRHEICLRDVSFRYTADQAPVLSEVSLSIPAGASVGLVGPNACGKTTLADVLAGLLQPQSGLVTIDGVPLDSSTRRSWHAAIAYVPQHVFLLDASVAENIAPGVPLEQIDRACMEQAVARARLAECVAAFPAGYAEKLGERGARLSGGQRQRLGIARALYREASLLIMDEATSSLDPQAEQEIVDMLESLRPRLTLVQIAHRAAALRHCDVIYELRHGVVARTSSYAELLRTPRQWSGTAGLQV